MNDFIMYNKTSNCGEFIEPIMDLFIHTVVEPLYTLVL